MKNKHSRAMTGGSSRQSGQFLVVWVPRKLSRELNYASLAKYFSSSATCEEHCARAYETLALELRSLDSPDYYIELAQAVAGEAQASSSRLLETAKEMGDKGRRNPVTTETTLRSLFQLALDNATDGCIRETYEAAHTFHQKQSAPQRQIARFLADAVAHRTRRAQFAWELHHWAVGQLSPERRRRILAEQKEAVKELRAEVRRDKTGQVADEVGVASASEASGIIDRLAERNWAPDEGPASGAWLITPPTGA